MTPLILRIFTAALLSVASLLIVLFRVSPLASPAIAIPLFFLTLFLTVATLTSLLSFGAWNTASIEGMDKGKVMSVALREGVFLASAVCLLFLFQILGILTWWIGLLIVLVFILVEFALHS